MRAKAQSDAQRQQQAPAEVHGEPGARFRRGQDAARVFDVRQLAMHCINLYERNGTI